MHNRRYFKGWYFKCCTKDEVIAFIPSYHHVGNNTFVSLQVITDSGSYRIPSKSLKYKEKPLTINLDNCIFSESGITLDIMSEALKIKGALNFRDIVPINYDIMGPFKIIPFMQCRHSIHSMMHMINGQITIGNKNYVFENGLGYIEGDRGNSFPKRYIWTQTFFDNGSLMLSVADIPFCGVSFTGIIGVIFLDGKEYRLATYLGAKVITVCENMVIIKQGKFELEAELLKKNEMPLLAPVNGNMSRIIHESVSCEAYYRFCYEGKTICEFVSDKAGFEFEYESN